MLDGKEVDGKIGEYGSYFVDADDKGVVEVGVSAKFDVVAELEKLALKSDNKIDDKIVALVKAALGRI